MVVLGFAKVVKTNCVAAPKVGVMLCVALVRPPTLNVSVYEVPATPEIPKPEKVAVPVTGFITAVVVPNVCPPRFTRTETVPATPVTVRLDASSTVITGCVVKAAPDVAPAADVVTTNFVATAAIALDIGLTIPINKLKLAICTHVRLNFRDFAMFMLHIQIS